MSTRKFLMTLAVPALVAPIVLGAVAVADGTADESHSECPIARKVTELVTGWKGAVEEARAMSPAEQQRLKTRMASLKEKCPVGSRLGDTLVAVRDVLGAVISAEEANAKHCPLEKTEAKRAANAAVCAEAKELKSARSYALRNLFQLANYVAGFTSGSCCDSERKATTPVIVSAPKTSSTAESESCDKAAASASSCPIRIASRLGSLKASWDTARREAQDLPAEKKREILTGFASLGESTKAVALVPPSAMALAEGFDALDAIHANMNEWAQKNPQFLRDLPEEALRSFQLQSALIDETRGVFVRVKETMTTMHGECSSDKAAADTAKS